MRRSEWHAHGGSERPRPASPASPGTAVSRRCQNRCACARYMHASMNKTHAASSLTLNESVRTPKSMYGARHAMLYARAMPCGGGWNSGHRCQKTPDLGLGEAIVSLRKACRNAKSRMRMRHDGACHVTDPPVPFLRNGARGKPKRRERSG